MLTLEKMKLLAQQVGHVKPPSFFFVSFLPCLPRKPMMLQPMQGWTEGKWHSIAWPYHVAMPWLCNCGAASTRHGIIVSSFARQEKVRKLLHPPFFPLPRERDLRPRSMIVRSYTHMHSRSIWASVNFITNRFMEISRDNADFYGWERNHGGGKQFPRLRKGKSPKGKKEGEDKRFFLHCLFSIGEEEIRDCMQKMFCPVGIGDLHCVNIEYLHIWRRLKNTSDKWGGRHQSRVKIIMTWKLVTR